MPDNLTATPEVTDISFLKDVVLDKAATPAPIEKTAEPAKEITDPADPAKVDPAKTEPAKTADPAVKTEDPAKVDPSKITPPAESEPINLTDDDLNDIIEQASGGKLQSYAELNEKLARLEELEKNPSALFNDPNKRQIFEFLNKYQGQDFETGIQNYSRLQKMNLESMDAETALKEAHMIENLNKGLTKEQIDGLWEYEKQEKYDGKGEIGEVLKTRDAIDAKKKLAELKEAATAPKVDSQQEQLQAKNQALRESYLTQVEQAIQNEQGQFNSLQIELSDNPEDAFKYEIQNQEVINDSIRNYGAFWNQRYQNQDGTFNIEQKKVDMTMVLEGPDLIQKAFEHGLIMGKERNIKERTNTPATAKAASNAANTSGLPKTLADSIMSGTMR